MTARATRGQTPVSVMSSGKREASEMRSDPNTVSTPPHPVEEAVALTPERIAELRKIAEAGSEFVPANHPASRIAFVLTLLSALERQREALERGSGPDGPSGLASTQLSRQSAPLGAALADIAAERHRQVEAEGWTPEHDDRHRRGELGAAAAVYAMSRGERPPWDKGQAPSVAEQVWPWDWRWFKPRDYRRNLIRAAALIVAEIERLDRATSPSPPLTEGE